MKKIEDYIGFEIYLNTNNGEFTASKDGQDHETSSDLPLLREEIEKILKRMAKPMPCWKLGSFELEDARITSAKVQQIGSYYSKDTLVLWWVNDLTKYRQKDSYDIEKKFIKPTDENKEITQEYYELQEEIEQIRKKQNILKTKIDFFTGTDIRKNFNLPKKEED